MPWTGEEFRTRHNTSLTPAEADEAASIANAMLKRGVSESEAIATANARAEKKRRKRAPKRTYGGRSW